MVFDVWIWFLLSDIEFYFSFFSLQNNEFLIMKVVDQTAQNINQNNKKVITISNTELIKVRPSSQDNNQFEHNKPEQDSCISLSSNTRRHKMPEIILRFIMQQARQKKANQPAATKGQQLLIKYKMKKKPKMEKCNICEQEVLSKEMATMSKCQHKFCTSCLHQYAIYKISAFQAVQCPSEECHASVDQQSKCFMQLPIKVRQKYRKLKQYTATLKDPTLKMCPDENCEGFLKSKKPQNQNIVIIANPQCSACNKIFCSNCMFAQHEGECDPFHLSFFQDTLHYRRCSNCKNVIQKSQGCNHMTCRCGYQFCYVCGAKWTSTHVCNNPNVPVQQDCCTCCQCYVDFCNSTQICFQNCCNQICDNCCGPICECINRTCCQCQQCSGSPCCQQFGKVLFFIIWLLFIVPSIYFLLAFLIAFKLVGGIFFGVVGFPCLLAQTDYEIQYYHIILGIVLLPVTLVFFMFLGIKFMFCEESSEDHITEVFCLPCQILSDICNQ